MEHSFPPYQFLLNTRILRRNNQKEPYQLVRGHKTMKWSRSVVKDVRAMTLGIDLLDQEIKFWENKKNTDRSIKKRLERLNEARKQLIQNPESANELMSKIS